jgi:DnaJ-class molecular chaperone
MRLSVSTRGALLQGFNDSAAVRAMDENIQDGAAIETVQTSSGSHARVCGICQGSGEIRYEYHFRAMTECCTQCDGEGIIKPQRSAECDKMDAVAQQDKSSSSRPHVRVMSKKLR